MAEYYKNKYPIKPDSSGINDIPVGTTFIITGICDNKFELTATGYAPAVVEFNVLLSGFTCSDKVLYQSFILNYSSLLDQIAEYVQQI